MRHHCSTAAALSQPLEPAQASLRQQAATEPDHSYQDTPARRTTATSTARRGHEGCDSRFVDSAESGNKETLPPAIKALSPSFAVSRCTRYINLRPTRCWIRVKDRTEAWRILPTSAVPAGRSGFTVESTADRSRPLRQYQYSTSCVQTGTHS
ncbi:MAG: hypothetical protein FRX48_02360 [Lasallia pustulata]|uniref:Uncharacterized protein n=1 Tax=Lasallia pustulata TaxID=136370 RepID=A0A5M8PZA1_9LECA|nr:MAG: hypothetical protein FRX48_02360 [Lasallia pustulata]